MFPVTQQEEYRINVLACGHEKNVTRQYQYLSLVCNWLLRLFRYGTLPDAAAIEQRRHPNGSVEMCRKDQLASQVRRGSWDFRKRTAPPITRALGWGNRHLGSVAGFPSHTKVGFTSFSPTLAYYFTQFDLSKVFVLQTFVIPS